MAFDKLGAHCVFASEKDASARKTYETNFKKISPQLFGNSLFNEDILKINPHMIPDFDILCAGFPCQPFSQAGYKRGFGENLDDRGNMFFNIRDIIKTKRPRAVFLENVRHLLKHDEGRTFETIRTVIEDELGYDFYYQIIKASDYGLPQHRPRIFMIGVDRNLGIDTPFKFPDKVPLKYTLSDIFDGKCDKDVGYTLRVGGRGSKINDRRNWEFYKVDGKIKRLGITEGKKMMGLPNSFQFPVSETQAMKQMGNSVAIDAIEAVAKTLVQYLDDNIADNQNLRYG